jgi:phospholipase C
MVGRVTRRRVLELGALAAAAHYAPRLDWAGAAALRGPDTLPDPSRAAGEPTAALPFDHLVIVMQENHSFDNYFGMLPRRGRPQADGFTFDASGRPTNSNPYRDGFALVQPSRSLCQPGSVTQNWRSTHRQIDGGRMDGFAATAPASMLYWDEGDLPFYYSLARTFCLGDRWFSSAPCQTYPNRRFLLAGTAFGQISTDTSMVFQDPPNGTIVDRLDAHGIMWRDYFTDVPATGVIASIPEKHPANLAPVAQFSADCAAGTLPAVSFVDSDIGLLGESGNKRVGAQSQSEENPADIAFGENFVAGVVGDVLRSPLWPRILLIWTYDEHGGYYDHVPPPAAIPPDDIPPKLGPNDPPGGYDIYGPRVPAVIVSGHARPGAVTSVVHDHTSILATIEAKWNLPAMTRRDANAATLADFLSAGVTFPEPPKLAAPSDLGASERGCSTDEQPLVVSHGAPPPAASPSGGDGLVVRFYGRRRSVHGVLVTLNMRAGTASGLVVELLRGTRVAARTHVAHVGKPRHRVALHGVRAGRYTLVVRRGRRVVVRRRVRVGK